MYYVGGRKAELYRAIQDGKREATEGTLIVIGFSINL